MYANKKSYSKRRPAAYAGRRTAPKTLVVAKTRPATNSVKPTKLMATMVREIVSRTEEKKFGSIAGSTLLSAYNTGNPNLASSIIPLTPYALAGITVAQGTGQSDRIGNKIRISSSRFRGVMFPTPYGANNDNPMPQNIRMWFFTCKFSTELPTTLPSFLQAGNNASASPQGNLLDFSRNVNSDLYTYKGHRDFKVGAASYTGASGVPAQAWGYANNDYGYNAFFDIDVTAWMPATIQFNDADNTPYSKCLLVYAEAVCADGTVGSTTDNPVTMQFVQTIQYTDV